tara:strand:- start:1593 stop:1877 length:285 start_codon:yes stop_codon:yes gene_type:complete
MTYIPILTDPTEFNGKDIQQCNVCQNDLNTTEEQEEKLCFECIEEKEERKELKYKKAQRETLNKIFDSFSIATIDIVENKKFDVRLKNFINNLK